MNLKKRLPKGGFGKRKAAIVALTVSTALVIAGCQSARYVKSELTGTAKPEGGIRENIPPSKTYSVSPPTLRKAVLSVLEEQHYVYEENVPAGTIKTSPKLLTDTGKVQIMGAMYSAKLFVKLDGSTVSYRATFDKKSNLTMPELDVEYPEKENELRKHFFAALDTKLAAK